MRPKYLLHPALLAIVVLGLAGTEAEAQQRRSFAQKLTKQVAFDPRGTLVIENPLGAVNVEGTSEAVLDITAHWVVSGVDDAAIAEGRRQTQIYLGGTTETRLLRSVIVQPSRDQRWSVSVSYFIKVPRSVNVNVASRSGEGISVTRITGNVNVRNMTGPIHLNSVNGLIRADSVNGNIYATYPLPPTVNAFLSTVNGHIQVTTPRNAAFTWHAETLKGDFLTSLSLRGGFSRRPGATVYRASVNGGTSPIVQTVTMTGRVSLGAEGLPTQSLLASTQGRPGGAMPQENVAPSLRRVSDTLLVQPPTASSFVAQRNLVNGNYKFETSLGNVFAGEVRGDADITTRAGEIVIGRVAGSCDVTSLGGPLNLGDIQGVLNARTAAGHVHVRAARKGGSISTDGGNVHVVHAGGPVRLHSGGGDIILQNATSRVSAETKSGDISLTLDGTVRSQTVDLKSVRGNIVLNVPPGFAADVDITIITSSDVANRIDSQLPGLSIIRDQVGGRTRIRGVGKFNGGGQKVTLVAEDGSVHVRSQNTPQMVVLPPRQ